MENSGRQEMTMRERVREGSDRGGKGRGALNVPVESYIAVRGGADSCWFVLA